MPTVLRMPGVSANATEAVLAEWLVAESAEFAAADALATVETDKALVDVEAETAGVVLKTLVTPGSQVEVGAPIAVLGAVGEQVDDLAALLAELGVAEATDPVVPPRREVPDTDPGSGSPLPEPGPVTTTPSSGSSNGRVFASPLARRMARDAGLPIEDIPGTGPRQRVLRRDVEAALAQPRPEPTLPRRFRPSSSRPRPRRTTTSRTRGCAGRSPSGWWRASSRRPTSTCGRRSGSNGCSRCAPSSTTPWPPRADPRCRSTTWS